jgi:prolyl-tRNA synthetase
MKGVPLRIEIGPRDVEAGNVVLIRRDSGEKTTVRLSLSLFRLLSVRPSDSRTGPRCLPSQ